MLKKLALLFLVLTPLFALGQGSVQSAAVIQWQQQTPLANPPAGTVYMYLDRTTGLITCKNSSGVSVCGAGTVQYPGVPSGTCQAGQTAVDLANGAFYYCNNGSWSPIAAAAGATAFSAVTAGTNTTALVIGNGGTLAATGTGTITATAAPWSGLTGFPTACTNQAVTGVGASLTCTTLSSSYVDTSIITTGGDIDTSNHVTATHLASALPVVQGGTGVSSGTAGGILYWATGTSLGNTGVLSAGVPILANASSAPFAGTVTGGTTEFATWSGATTGSRCVHTDGSGNLTVSAADCGVGSITGLTQSYGVDALSSTTVESQPWTVFITSATTGANFCQKVLNATTGYASAAIFDARAISTGMTCPAADANAMLGAIAAGSTLLLPPGTITIGSAVRTDATTCANGQGSPASSTCTGGWVMPRITIRGTSLNATTVAVDTTGCSGAPKTGCSNWPIRSATITGFSNPSSKWVTLTVSGLVGGTPVVGELVDVQTTNSGSPDANWGTFRICGATTNSPNGCPHDPTSTQVSYYNENEVANGTPGGKVFFATPVISLGPDAVTSSAQSPAAFANNVRLEDLTIDCQGIAGCIGWTNTAAEEGSWVKLVSIRHADMAGFALINGNISASGFSNSGPYVDLYNLETGSNPVCHWGTLQGYIGNNSIRGFLGGGTFENEGCVGSTNFYGYPGPNSELIPAVGLKIEGNLGNSLFSGFHVEDAVTGVKIGEGMPSTGVGIQNFKGHSTLTNCVVISNNFASSDYSLISVANPCTNTIVDQVQGLTSTDSNVGLWTYDKNGSNVGFLTTGSFANLFGSGLTAGSTMSSTGTLSATGIVNFSAATHTASIQSGTTAAIPATCTFTAGVRMDVYVATDATAGQNLYFCTATNTWTQQLNSGASGANVHLSNLSGVAVNASLVPNPDNSVDIGAAATRWRDVWVGRNVDFTTAGNVADSGICRGAAGTLYISDGATACDANGNLFAAGFASGSATIPTFHGLTLPEIVAPSAPSAGTQNVWVDSTDHRLHDEGSAATIGTTVVAHTATTHQFVTAISAAGVISQAQPASSDLSDATTIVFNQSTNTGTAAMTLDMHAATTGDGLRVPVHAGDVAAATGSLTEDATAANYHIYANGADAIVLSIPAAPTTGHLYDSAVSGSNVLAHDSGVVTANVVTDTTTATANAVMVGGGSKTVTVSDLLESSNLLSNATTTQLWTISGGKDASANSALGGLTLRGADETGAGGSTSAGGNVIVRGGNNAGTNGSTTAGGGSTLILPGASTGATQNLQGLLGLGKVYVKAATSTLWDLACISSTTAMTTKNCGATPTNFLGVFEAINSNTDVILSAPSQVPVNASGAVTVGDTVCAGGSAGQITDSGGTASCTHAQGATVGVVVAVAGTFTIGDGVTAILSTTLPLIDMNPAVLLPSASGGSPSLDQVSGSAAQTTATEVSAGDNYGFAGKETAALTYPFFFTNASGSNNSSGALIVETTGTGTSQVPLVIAEDGSGTNAGDLLDAYNGATNTAGTLSGGSKVFAISIAGAITTGSWSGTAIPIAKGGTNATSAAAGQVPNSTSGSAASWTATPTLGIAGTTTGTLTLASSTASGSYVITAPANAATPTLTLPIATGTFFESAGTNTAGSAAVYDLSALTTTPALKLPAAVGATSLLGTVTANLSAPIVITNTNSSNNNTSITMGITAPGTSTGQTVLNINGAATGGDLLDLGTGASWSSGGVISGQTIVAAFSAGGALSLNAGACTAGTAGVACLGEGTAPTAAANYDQIYADSTNHMLEASLNNFANDGSVKFFSVKVDAINTQVISYAAVPQDSLILCNKSTAMTITLLTSGIPVGKTVTVKNINTGACTVTPASGNIDAATTVVLPQYSAVNAVWNGTQWYIF